MKKSLLFWSLVQYKINKRLERASGWCCGVLTRACCAAKWGVLAQSHDPRDTGDNKPHSENLKEVI